MDKFQPVVKPYHKALRVSRAFGPTIGREYMEKYPIREAIERAACGLPPYRPKNVNLDDEAPRSMVSTMPPRVTKKANAAKKAKQRLVNLANRRNLNNGGR